MFTGIIQTIGNIKSIRPIEDDGVQITVMPKKYSEKLNIGSSHSINGVCLTTLKEDLPLIFDLSSYTLNKTSFINAKVGDLVNIEPGMKVGDSFDGHIVSGHVDGLGVVSEIIFGEDTCSIYVKYPECLDKYIAENGSICIDGTSLTINSVANNVFKVTIVPHTLENTICQFYQKGTSVNLEIDLIARYLDKLVGKYMKNLK